MKLEKNDIIEFITNHKDMEIEFNCYDMQDEIVFNLYSFKLKVGITISDSCDNFATDKSLYIDYVYLDDGTKAWQIQINSKYLMQDGIDKLKGLLPKIFDGEKIQADSNLLKPLHKNCNFARLE